jgi:Chitobiase/beta-hexosaminidase C-terminal domain
MNATTTWSGSLSHTLAASFYLTAKPAFFGSQPFPLNGPDVTGGTGVGGFANKTPAQVNYEALGGTDGTGSPIAGFNAQAFFGSTGGTVATPTFSPVAGTYSSTQTVTISDSTGGATICYTTDGSTPTANGAGTCTHGTTYSSAVIVATTLTLQAVGSLSGDSDSSVGSAAYTITPTTAGTPSCSPVGGTYNATQSVSCSVTGGAPVMCYTTNGTPPVTNGSSGCTTGTLYSGAISISASATFKVIAGGTAFLDGTVDSQIYTLTVATPTFNPVGGTYFGAQSVTISTVTSGATITYTTDGSTPVPGSHGTVYAFPVLVSTSLTLKAVGGLSGFNNSAAGSAGYTINPPLIAPANPAVTMQ